MSAIKKLFRREYFPALALLASSLLMTIGRGMTLPFMAIYLSRKYAMSVQDIGIAMTAALVAGVVFSLWFGMLADRFDKKKSLLLATAIFCGGFFIIPAVSHASLVILFYAIINCSYSVFSVVLKGYFSDTVAISSRPKIFSVNYTIINIGWTIGPPLGTLAVMYSSQLPFLVSGISAAIPFFLVCQYVKAKQPTDTSPSIQTFSQVPLRLLRDKPLMWFTLSALLSSLVYGTFANCLSQYMLQIRGAEAASHVVTVTLSVNAMVVVLCQYLVGRRIAAHNIYRMMQFGTLFFVLGLVGFWLAQDNLWIWGLSAFIFTLGEIIYAPGEFMLVDSIAPDGQKVSYFAAQQLGWLGGALNPLVTGLVLSAWPAGTLFLVLIVCILGACLAVAKGITHAAQRELAVVSAE